MNKIGICGTGKMGKEIGKRLLDCDQTVTAWNRTQNKVTPLVELGAIRANSVKELFENNDIILIIMGNDVALDYVYTSSQGIKNQDLTNKIIIELSTTSIKKMQSLERVIYSLNGEFIECPVGGSTKPARDGNLLGLVGGNKETFEKVEHILKLICRRYEYLGEVGKGSAMKLAINLPLMVYWHALGEAMSLATNSGIKFDKALDIMFDSSGAAKVAHLKSNTILQAKKDETNLSSTFNVSSSLKDINLMIEEGANFNNELHVIKSTKSYIQGAMNEGWSDHDASLLSLYINKKLNN